MGIREQVVIGLWAAFIAFGLFGFPIFAKGMGGALGGVGRGLERFYGRIADVAGFVELVLVTGAGLFWLYDLFDVRGLLVLGLVATASVFAISRMYGSAGPKRALPRPDRPPHP